MKAPAKPRKAILVEFKDDPKAPEFFSDGATGAFVHNGVMRLTFEAARVDHTTSPGPVNRVVVCRVALPIIAAEALRDFLIERLDALKEPGPTPQAQGPTTIQ